jgi:hypothetical protein
VCQVNPDHAGRTRTRFQWNLYRLTAALREVSVLAGGARNLAVLREVLIVPTDPADSVQGLTAYIGWLEDEFLLGRRLDVKVLRIGLNAVAVFHEGSAGCSLDAESIARLLDARDTRAMAEVTREILLALQFGATVGSNVMNALTELRRALSLAPNFDLRALDSLSPAVLVGAWPTCLKAAKLVHLAVPHALHEPCIDGPFDWDGVRESVAQHHAAGRTDVGVIIEPDGAIALGRIDAVTQGNVEPAPVDEGVLVSSASGGFVSTEFHAWKELKQGSLGGRRSQSGRESC